MQQRRTYMAVGTSKYGLSTVRLVMDILEEIVGEISDGSIEAEPI